MDPTTTTAPAVTTSEPTTLPTLDPATQDLEVTVAPFDLHPDLLAATEGMVLGIDREFLFEDGGLGGGPLVVRVEGGEAQIVRGRWCGTDWGPAPLDDLSGGVVVAPYEQGYEVVRCAPGSEVQKLSSGGTPAHTALIDGEPVLALMSWSEVGNSASVNLKNLDTGDVTTLLEIDASSERPTAVSRSQDGVWVVTLIGEGDYLKAPVRYVLVDDEGGPVDARGNPQPHYDEGSGFGAAALTPDGRLLTLRRDEDSRTELTVWDLETGSELARHRVLSEFHDDPETPWPEGRYAESIYTDGSRAVVNVTAVAEEPHPYGIVIVDLVSGDVTGVSREYRNVLVKLGSFILR